jgi:glycerophosphoryl diester phosphodiesterase
MGKLIKIAHRGGAAHELENSLRAFRNAISLNSDMIELDVHRCKSGEIIVMHDASLRRTTAGHGFISKRTFLELREVVLKSGDKIPTLEEVLLLIKHRVRVDIELKGRGTTRLVVKLVEKMIHYHGWKYRDFLLTSFFHKRLKKVKSLNPRIRTGALIRKTNVRLSKYQKLEVYSINPRYDFVTPQFVAKFHQAGIKVLPWVVNRRDDIIAMKKMGVDGIITDFPDKVF